MDKTIIAEIAMFLLSKRDPELPMAVRVARWGCVVLALAYALLAVIEKGREAFA